MPRRPHCEVTRLKFKRRDGVERVYHAEEGRVEAKRWAVFEPRAFVAPLLAAVVTQQPREVADVTLGDEGQGVVQPAFHALGALVHDGLQQVAQGGAVVRQGSEEPRCNGDGGSSVAACHPEGEAVWEWFVGRRRRSLLSCAVDDDAGLSALKEAHVMWEAHVVVIHLIRCWRC